MVRKLFLPVGMVLAVVLSFFFPGVGIAVKKTCGSSAFIVLIFLVCGWQTHLKDVHFDRRFFTSFAVFGILTLTAAPWLGAALAKVFALDVWAATGLVVMACMPPTLSSGIVMTETSGGNVMLGVLMTVFYNLLGVLTMPLMLTWCLASQESIETHPLSMFASLLLLVVLPFAAGFAAHKRTGRELPAFCSYIPSACVILLILSFFSSAAEMFRTYPLKTLFAAGGAGLVLRVSLMLILWNAGRLLKLPEADRKAAIFTAGSKTLTIAIAMLAILNAGDGPALIPCMVFYFIQAIFDSLLAGKMGLSAQKKEKPASV